MFIKAWLAYIKFPTFTYVKQFARPINELAGLLNILQSVPAARVFEVMEQSPRLWQENI